MEPTESNDNAAPLRAQWFATTHWSVVLSAADQASPKAADALEKLCETYWLPLYTYVRRNGHGPEDAQDLTQAFFANFLEKNAVGRARRDRGRFRSFLLTSLQNFMAHEWEKARAAKRGGGVSPLPWDELSAESSYQLETGADLTPDKAFERRYAMTLFQRALTRLSEELSEAGKADTFNELKGFLTEAAGEEGYASAALRLNMAPGTVAVAVHRLRKRYAQLVREEIANTVTSPEEIEDEMRYLISLMSG
jgi:RNA polymerase sigma factor (sigma-70 family)